MSIAKQEFTNAGRSMLGRAQAGETLTISKLVVGSGGATAPSELWPLTALIAHEMDVVISSKRDFGNGTLMIEGSFRSDTAPHSFSLKEVGVMAHVAAEADRLYSVANCLAEPPDLIDPAAPTMQVFKLKLVIDRIPEDDLIIQIGPSENVVGENIGADTVGAGVYKEAAGNILKFKRLIEGSGIALTETPDDITIATRTLDIDLDLYVPLTYPGISDPDIMFPSVQEAHDHLLQYSIPSNRSARIHVAAGTFHHNGITFSHPDSKQISLLGWARQDKTCTQIINAGGTAKNVSVNTSGLSVGMIVYLTNCHSGWTGGCKITGIFTGFVVCSVLNRSSRPIFNITDSGADTRMSWFPTVLVCDNLTYGISNLLFPNGIKQVENITAEKGYAGFGLGDVGRLKNCMAIDCIRGFSSAAALMALEGECVASDCDFGVSGGLISALEVFFANGCGAGVAPSGGGSAVGAVNASMPDTFAYINHCIRGIHCFGGANLRCGHVIYDTNDLGMVSEKGSIIQASPEAGTPYNNGTDLYAQGMSYIEYFRAGSTVPTCNPAAEAVGNQNSIIHVLP